jgi:hypothetical protein
MLSHIVNHLSIDMQMGTKHSQSRSLGGTRDFAANAAVATLSSEFTVGFHGLLGSMRMA